jgi:LacI family transcriptional regulator
VKGVTNLILDHHSAAEMALKHLIELGHKEIAVMKGPTSSSDSEDRWQAIIEVGHELGIRINPQLTVRLNGDKVTPDLGYVFARDLLARNHGPFTALFAYNDRSAMGAIRAINEAGLGVPEDISVVGFDDIESAAYSNPALTTVRQPLQKMGEMAARTLLNLIEKREPYVAEITVEPEFVVRRSTGPAPNVAAKAILDAELALRN